MEKKPFVSRLKQPTTTPSALPPLTRPIMRRSKSVADLATRVTKNRSPLKRTNPLMKSAVSIKPPASVTTRVPLKPYENGKSAAKRPGPAIDNEPIKPKVLKTSKPPPYDYKARYNMLNEKHTALVKNFKDAKQKFVEAEPFMLQYKQVEKELGTLKKTCYEMTKQNEKLSQDCHHATTNWNNLETENKGLLNDKISLSERLQKLEESCTNIGAKLKAAEKTVAEYATTIAEFKSEALSHEELRRYLHNQIQDLKGTIRVFCRVRPSLATEHTRIMCNINYLDEGTLEVRRSREVINNITGKSVDGKLEFGFDKVFSGDTSQAVVFEELAQLVQSALDGYHVCVFAYGQTGSGKTYTMVGDCSESSLGMIPRSVILIFDLLQKLCRQGWKYEVECNFLEIYNEAIRDLLHPNNPLPHDIHFNEGRGITVTNMTHKTVKSAGELLQLIELAHRNRAVAVTNFNEHSSRSHAVTRINLCGYNSETCASLKGSLNLVDLAGSESAKTSCTERLTETKNINKSLSMLGTVINALHNKEVHIPYRNSKLTYLLQSSLSGNAKALMFVNVAPFEECYNESISSLRFASKVKEIKMNARRNKMYLKKE